MKTPVFLTNPADVVVAEVWAPAVTVTPALLLLFLRSVSFVMQKKLLLWQDVLFQITLLFSFY